MRLLVVDNGKLVAARLGQALRALGHETIISPGLGQAIEAARHLAMDAVLVDVELPSMSGVEFAEALWLFDQDIPIAFRQCSQDSRLVARAAELGPLFPARWTPADLERVVLDLGRRGARGTAPDMSMPKPTAVPEAPALGPEEPTARDAWLLVPMRKIVRKINVSCRTWAQVEKLCDQRDAGKDFLTLRGAHELEPEDRLTVALRLPDGLSISIAAQVTSTRCEGKERIHVIHLVGFTPQRCAHLRAMAASVRLPMADMGRGSGMSQVPADVGSMRHQIDSLAGKMRPAAAAASERGPRSRLPRGMLDEP